MEIVNILERAGVPPELARATSQYFTPIDPWENSGIRVSDDRLSVYHSLSAARERGIEPTNYTVKILMDPYGEKEEYTDILPPPP